MERKAEEKSTDVNPNYGVDIKLLDEILDYFAKRGLVVREQSNDSIYIDLIKYDSIGVEILQCFNCNKPEDMCAVSLSRLKEYLDRTYINAPRSAYTSCMLSSFPIENYDDNIVRIGIYHYDAGASHLFQQAMDNELDIGGRYSHLMLNLYGQSDYYNVYELVSIINSIVASRDLEILSLVDRSGDVQTIYNNGKPYAIFDSIEVLVDSKAKGAYVLAKVLERMRLPNVRVQYNHNSSSSFNMLSNTTFPISCEYMGLSIPTQYIITADDTLVTSKTLATYLLDLPLPERIGIRIE